MCSWLLIGSGVATGRFAALDIAAFRTCANGGFIPQARHGANGVCTVAVVGSKLDGTGFENVHIGQIQVALFAGAGSGGGRWNELSDRLAGAAEWLRIGKLRATVLFWNGDFFGGFGTSVIFGDDFKKPA